MGPVWVDGTIFHHGALVMGIQKGQLFDWDLGHLGKQTEADINGFFLECSFESSLGKIPKGSKKQRHLIPQAIDISNPQPHFYHCRF
jgi:hypothetical protein